MPFIKGEERNHWFVWAVGCLLLLSALLVHLNSANAPRRATVTIDTNGTARLGGVLPLRNKTFRDAALTAVGRLNGGTASIAAARSTAISNLLEVYGAMRKVGITSVVVQAESSPPQQHPEKKKP